MSGGGGGVIIIKSLIENPGTSAPEKDRLQQIYAAYRARGYCTWSERRYAKGVLNRLLKSG
jgi:hypothetical protein